MKVLGTILLLCVFGIPRIAITADGSQYNGSQYKSAYSSSTSAPSTRQETSAGAIVSRNFRVLAPNERLAREVAKAAEVYRSKLALSWFGSPLPHWDAPYLIRVSVGHQLRANITTNSDRREITLEGTRALLLKSTLPRGILHSLFATRDMHSVAKMRSCSSSILEKRMLSRLFKKKTLKIQRIRGVLVVCFDVDVIPEDEVQQIGRALVEAADSAASYEETLLLDFNAVRGMSSAMIGKLVLLDKLCRNRKIELRICNLSPDLFPPDLFGFFPDDAA